MGIRRYRPRRPFRSIPANNHTELADTGRVGRFEDTRRFTDQLTADTGRVGRFEVNCKGIRMLNNDTGRVGRFEEFRARPRQRTADTGRVGRFKVLNLDVRRLAQDTGRVGRWVPEPRYAVLGRWIWARLRSDTSVSSQRSAVVRV